MISLCLEYENDSTGIRTTRLSSSMLVILKQKNYFWQKSKKWQIIEKCHNYCRKVLAFKFVFLLLVFETCTHFFYNLNSQFLSHPSRLGALSSKLFTCVIYMQSIFSRESFSSDNCCLWLVQWVLQPMFLIVFNTVFSHSLM